MANWPAIRAGIFAGESGGDYDALFGFSNRPGGRFANTRLTDMTVDQALNFASPSGPYGQWVKGKIGRVATPMGGFQVVGTTLKAAKEGMGLTGNERMTPEVQDQIGQWILAKQGTGAWEGYRGPGDPSSFPGVPVGPSPSSPGGGARAASEIQPPTPDQTFGTMAPTMAGMQGTPGTPVPSAVADYANSKDPKTFGERLGDMSKAYDAQLPKAPRLGPMQGPGNTGNALLEFLNSPTAADLLMKKRMSGVA